MTGQSIPAMKFLRKKWHLAASGLLGILMFLAIFGLEPLRYTGIGWTQHGFGGHDITQHQIGWMFYRNSPWTFPLCKALFLGYPEGTSISYTDSIPLAALFFKLLSPLLPENFQYFGLYTCFCFMMQGIFSSALLYLFTKDKLYSTIGSTIFTAASCFVERCFRHTALSSHWLILAALLLYLIRKRNAQKKHYVLISVLFCISLGIHPYLFAMVFAVLTLSEAETFFADPGSRRNSLFFAVCIGAAILFGYVLDLFGAQIAPVSGYGMYSLNLNAIFNPHSAHHRVWSAYLQNREIFPAQGDGMYYLGLPMLVLTGIALLTQMVFRFKSFIKVLRRYRWLIFLLAGFTVFAVSNVFTFDDRIVKIIPLPTQIQDTLEVFRASARFFFLPYYCLILLALISLYRIAKNRRFVAVFCCLITAVLQITEIRPGLRDLHRFFETRYDYIDLSEEWQLLAQRYHTAKTFDFLTNQSLAFWLAKNNFRTDMMITAPIHMDAYWQQTEGARNRLRQALAAGSETLNPDTIYIISTETGTNRSFSNDSELESYIESVRTAYKDRAELKFLTDWVRDYWVLCPLSGS